MLASAIRDAMLSDPPTVDVILDYPWMCVVSAACAAGTRYDLSLTEDADDDDLRLFFDSILPRPAFLVRGDGARELPGVRFGLTASFWVAAR